MNLNITEDSYGKTHSGKLFPGAEEREYSYQSEGITFNFEIRGTPPNRQDGKLNRGLPDDVHDGYQLVIQRHTGKQLTFKLFARRKDTIPQRIRNGFAVTHDVLIASMDFAELCNRIFETGAQVFTEEEHFPQEVKDAMKTAYRTAS